MSRYGFVGGFVCAVAATAMAAADERYQPVKDETRLASPAIDEASGMAGSPADAGFLWLVNDSGAKAVLHLAGTDGADRGQVEIEGAENVDWEDLAAFRVDGTAYLLVADTGDNGSVRSSCDLYLVKEPALPGEGRSITGTIPAKRISFTYEDGPRDCESVSVDVAAGKIILISKRTKPPVVYEMPLPLDGGDKPLVAKRLGETRVKPPAGVPPLPYIDQPTGLSIRADGLMAAVVTYYGVFVFPRQGKEGWGEVFAREALVLVPHRLQQAESIAFSKDGKNLYVASEGAKEPLRCYERVPEKP